MSLPDRGEGTSFVEECGACDDARRLHGTCTSCEKRWVAGLLIGSALLHEALDAHGHEVEAETLICLDCAEAIEVDGFCRRCRMGFLDGQLYFSELSWSLHHGKVRLGDEVQCSKCRDLYGTTGTCATCRTIWVGNVAFTDPARAPMATRQFGRLRAALERLASCEMCATAGFFGRSCPTCGTEPIPGVLSPPEK